MERVPEASVAGTEGIDGPDVFLDRHREIASLVPRMYLGALAVLAVVVAAVPRFGLWPLLLLGPSMVIAIGIERISPATAAGIQASTTTHLVFFAQLGVVIVLTGKAQSFAIPWAIAPCLMPYLRHPVSKANKLAWVCLGIALLPLAVVDPMSIVHDPLLPLATAVGVLFVTLFGAHLATAEIRNRGLAVIDPLTGLLNRRSLSRRVDELRQQGAVLGSHVQLALIVLDIDHFKRVNDTHGHATGDAVLRDVAYELRKVLRRFDAVFRVGGEEFVVVVPDAGASEAGQLAERLRRAIEERRFAGLAVTISLGVAVGRMGTADLESLVDEADHALYRAKAGGRNRVAVSAGRA